MKKFLFKIFLFFLPIGLLSFFLDITISNNLKKSNSFAHSEYSTWNAIIDEELNSEIYIYGSSRAWKHFNPIILQDSLNQKVYNLGIDGHPLNMQILRHELVLEKNLTPKTIIHSVDIGTFKKGNLYNKVQFLPYMLNDQTFFNRMKIYEGFTFFDYKLPLLRYYGNFEALKTAIKMMLNFENPTIRIKGYLGSSSTWNDDLEKAKSKIGSYIARPDTDVVTLFDEYLKECVERNIDVILVYSPYHISGQSFIKNQDEVINIYRGFANKYKLKFLDFTKDDICHHKKYFYNASHLNKEGAELFSKKLAQILKSEKILK